MGNGPVPPATFLRCRVQDTDKPQLELVLTAGTALLYNSLSLTIISGISPFSKWGSAQRGNQTCSQSRAREWPGWVLKSGL